MATYKETILNRLPVLTLSCNLLKNITLDDIIIHANLYNLGIELPQKIEFDKDDCICDEFEISTYYIYNKDGKTNLIKKILITLKTTNFDNMYNMYLYCYILYIQYAKIALNDTTAPYTNPLQSYIHDVFSYMMLEYNFDYKKYSHIVKIFYNDCYYLSNKCIREDIKTQYTTLISNFKPDYSERGLQKLTFGDTILFLYYYIIYDLQSIDKLFHLKYIATRKYKDPNLNPNIILLYAVIHDIQFGCKIPKFLMYHKIEDDRKSSEHIKYVFPRSYIYDVADKLRNASVYPVLVYIIYYVIYHYTSNIHITIEEFYEQYATSANIKSARKC